MKLTLAFDIFNKEKWIESLLDSWISNLSGKHEYEIIVVFDACKDRSVEIAEAYLQKRTYAHKFLFADDKFEIFCNNLALEHATGDYIVFIQDDNWMHDRQWDDLLFQVVEPVPNLGVIGLLAGLRMLPPKRNEYKPQGIMRMAKQVAKHLLGRGQSMPDYMLNYERIEIDRPHKGVNFTAHNSKPYKLGVWQVDAICRPFSVSVNLLKSYGGLDKAFSPTCGDDLDLSIKFLCDHLNNLYIPFDVVNLTASKDTQPSIFHEEAYQRAYRICASRYSGYLLSRPEQEQYVKLLMPLEYGDGGVMRLC